MIDFENKSPKILVIGDLIVDRYLWGLSERISPEAPVQVIDVQRETLLLGGAGNVIHNLKTLGAKVDILSVIGNCNTSIKITELLQSIGIQTDLLITQKNRITPQKSRIIVSRQQVVRYDQECSDDIDSKSQNLLLSNFEKIVEKYDVILLSDYGKGVLTHKLTQSLIKTSNKSGKKIIIDPKGSDFSKYSGAYLLTPNKLEASKATKILIKDNSSLTEAIKKLKTKFKLNISLITLSNQGIASYDKELCIYPTNAKEVFDVTGAGDTVLASLGFALAIDLNMDKAIEFANLAAGIVVGKIGSATTTISEIQEYQSIYNQSKTVSHIKTRGEIIALSKELKNKDKKIIFTNGCFDLLHAGHVKYLEAAKNFGDVLILGLNSDRSVRSIKGANRPINKQSDRAYLLAALEAVDYVVIFDEDTPYELIKSIKPSVLVKGGDYNGQKVIGEDLVDELKLVDFIEEKSTTQTIDKILQKN
jgi:D-beta-D-heptose 7-phosphate kinase/D-beta-D-heptose 1-phosphate adenosyltransferase